jgi:hypothetical protein
MTIAGIAMGTCALGGIAYYAGWLPTTGAPEVAMTSGFAGTQSGVVLAPGESLVAPAGPIVAPVKAEPPPAPPAAKKPSKPKNAKAQPRKTPPKVAKQKSVPRYAGAKANANSYERSAPCAHCGVVTGMSHYDADWEVRVRFADGSRHSLRSRERPRVEIGDHVRLEGGRLVRE